MATNQALGSWLEMLHIPAFAVQDGRILCTNSAAGHLGISPGEAIGPLLAAGSEEYADFSGGCMYLTLQLQDLPWGASVTRLDGQDIFHLEPMGEQSQLRSLALAARSLRQPLSSLLATADQLFSSLARREDPREAEQMAQMNRNLYQLLRQVGNMSDAYQYGNTPQQGMELRDSVAVLEEILSKCQVWTRHAGRDLRISLPQDECMTFLDWQMLERAVLNLLSNALKFSPGEDTLEVSVVRRGNLLQLSFRDPATTLTNEVLSSLHQRYLREPGLEDPRYGTGLGMVLVRCAAAAHGGAVLITPDSRGGTLYSLTLRLRTQPPDNVLADTLRMDYAGEYSHTLVELSDILPADLYHPDQISGL